MIDFGEWCEAGWVRDDAEVERIMGLLPMPVFGDSAASLAGSGEGKDVFLWEAEIAVLGKLLDAWKQTLGTCVAQGTGRAVQDTLLCQIAFGKRPQQFINQVDTSTIYAGSRIEVGKRRLGRSEGSVGAWGARWCENWGVIPRGVYGSYDLTQPDDERAQEWGSSADGVPAALEAVAKMRPVKTISQISRIEEARDALANWHALAVCSSQGFKTQRDENGFCAPWGTWAHCMEWRGVGVARRNEPFVVIQQSWGNSPTGPDIVRLESGRETKLPMGCFACRFEVADRMLRQQDSWAFSGAEGWPAQAYDFSAWETAAAGARNVV